MSNQPTVETFPGCRFFLGGGNVRLLKLRDQILHAVYPCPDLGNVQVSSVEIYHRDLRVVGGARRLRTVDSSTFCVGNYL